MTTGKVTFRKKEILTILVVIIIVKLTIYYYPLMQPYFEESAYESIIGIFEKKTVSEMERAIKSKRDNDCELYYIGRGSCPDCRTCVENVRNLAKIAAELQEKKMYYIKLKNEISDDERQYLDSICIENIPTIIINRNGNVKQFGYDDIASSDYKTRFIDFLSTT